MEAVKAVAADAAETSPLGKVAPSTPPSVAEGLLVRVTYTSSQAANVPAFLPSAWTMLTTMPGRLTVMRVDLLSYAQGRMRGGGR